MNTTYTKIPLEKLNETRTVLNAQLKLLSLVTGVRYKTRTFYLGPRIVRPGPFGGINGSTLKSNAYAAKIGIYEENSIGYRSGSFDLTRYI